MNKRSLTTPLFFHFSRVHQHTRTVLQHILHVLSHWAGYVAGVLLAALLQGKEADRVERPVAPFPCRKLSGSQQTHPNIHPLWTSFSTQQQVWSRGSNSSFHSCQRKSTKVVLRKNDPPAYLVVET